MYGGDRYATRLQAESWTKSILSNFIGKEPCVFNIQNKALKPNTTYVFQLLIRTDAGDVYRLPIAWRFPESTSTTYSWHCYGIGRIVMDSTMRQRAQIEKYVLYGVVTFKPV